MKRYFKYTAGSQLFFKHPCRNVSLSVHDKIGSYNCFCDNSSFVLTPEDIGDIEDFDTASGGKEKYFGVARLLNIPDKYEMINFNEILSKAKAQGYKLIKKEVQSSSQPYVWSYKDTHYKIETIDRAYSIINDGEPAKFYYTNDKALSYIETSIGLALMLSYITSKKEIESLDKSNKIIRL